MDKENVNYFLHFGLKPSFKVDQKELKKRYIQKSREYHPDFHTLQTPSRKEESLRITTLNNEAYKTLKDFISTIQYCFSQFGPTDIQLNTHTIPQDFLMEMLEINDDIMESQIDESFDQNSKIVNKIDSMINEIQEKISSLLIINPHELTNSEWLQLADFYAKNKYLSRLKSNLSKGR